MRRHKVLIAAPALVLAVSSGLALSKLPALYQSSARMVLVESKSDEVRDLHSYLEKCRQIVADNTISIEPDTSSSARAGTFVVSYKAADPEAARSVVNEATKLLDSQSAKGASPAAGNLEALRSRVAALSGRIRKLEQTYPHLTKARSERPFPFSPQPAQSALPSAELIRAQQMTVEGLKDQQFKFQQQLNDVERRITSQRQVVEQQTKVGSLRNNPSYAVLVSRRAELQGLRDTLINRQELTDKHPRVAAISDQIAAIDRQIDELRQQDSGLVSQSPEARELASLESERNRLKLDLELTGRELARRTANQTLQPAPIGVPPSRRDRTGSQLMQDYLALTRSSNELAIELRDAEARSADAQPLPVRSLDEANLPSQAIGPNRILLISILAALGSILGLLLALICESRRLKSLQNADDVEYFARLPLLALIPKTETARDRIRGRWRAAARFALGAAASVAATFALSQFFLLSNIFDLIAKK